MNHCLKSLLCIFILFLTCKHAYSTPTELTEGAAQTHLFSDRISKVFESLGGINRVENLLLPKIISRTVAISPIKNKCSFKSLYQEKFISELNPLEYLIYFNSNEIRKKIFFNLMRSHELSSKSKAFVSSKFIVGLVNQGEHALIREFFLSNAISPAALTHTTQKYVECLLISGDQENLQNFYQLSTVLTTESDFFKILKERETLTPVLRELVRNFCENFQEGRKTPNLYPPFVTFVQTLNPSRNNQLQNTVARSWIGSQILQKVVNQYLEIGSLPANKKRISCWHRFNHELRRIHQSSPRSEEASASNTLSSVLVKRSAPSFMAGEDSESQCRDTHKMRDTTKKQKGNHDLSVDVVSHNPISRKRRQVMSNQDLEGSGNHGIIFSDSDVLLGSYNKKESEWLKSIGLPGQDGLYTQVDLPARKSILVYSGKIYDSEREIFNAFPEDTWDEQRETAYLLDVSDREGRYLYSVSGLEPESGKAPGLACFINHTVPEEANVFFERVPDKTAQKGYRPVIMTKNPIRAGSELKVFYGKGQHEKMLEESPEFRQFVEDSYPHHLPKRGSSSSSPSASGGINWVSPKASQLHPQRPSKKEFSDTSKLSTDFKNLLDSGDQLFKKGRVYSDEFQFKQALHQLREAESIYLSGFDLIKKEESNISQKKMETLKYNLDFRLSDLYWELAVNSLFLSQHSPDLQSKLKYSEDEAKYYKKSKELLSKQIDLDFEARKNRKAAASAEQTAYKRIQELLRDSDRVIQDDLELSYETAFGLKEKAVALIHSESHREKAISLYESALQYINSEQSGNLDHGYRQYLEADLNWSLGEVYWDDPMNDVFKARKCYKRAILLYRQLLQNHSGIDQADVSSILGDLKNHLSLAQSSLECLMKIF